MAKRAPRIIRIRKWPHPHALNTVIVDQWWSDGSWTTENISKKIDY